MVFGGIISLFRRTTPSRAIVYDVNHREKENFGPQLRNRVIDFDLIRTLELSPEDHPPCKISFRSDDMGGLSEYTVCHCH